MLKRFEPQVYALFRIVAGLMFVMHVNQGELAVLYSFAFLAAPASGASTRYAKNDRQRAS